MAGWASHGVDAFTFEDIVAQSFADALPQCSGSIRAAVDAIEAASPEKVASAFNVCEPRALGPSQSSELFAYALENLPQLNYPYAVGSLPAHPVRYACEVLIAAADVARDSSHELIKAAATVTALALGIPEGACIPFLGVGGPGNTPGDGPGRGSWGWQSCTETLHAFSARTIRNYSFDLGRSARQCSSLFPPLPPARALTPDPSLLARRYGGYALADGTAQVTRLIWSQGLLDPWHGWFRGVTTPAPASDVHHIIMEGAAHHLDLRGPHPDDPPAVTAARALELDVILRWLAEEASSATLPLTV